MQPMRKFGCFYDMAKKEKPFQKRKKTFENLFLRITIKLICKLIKMEKYNFIEEKILRYNMIIMKHDIPKIL